MLGTHAALRCFPSLNHCLEILYAKRLSLEKASLKQVLPLTPKRPQMAPFTGKALPTSAVHSACMPGGSRRELLSGTC